MHCARSQSSLIYAFRNSSNIKSDRGITHICIMYIIWALNNNFLVPSFEMNELFISLQILQLQYIHHMHTSNSHSYFVKSSSSSLSSANLHFGCCDAMLYLYPFDEGMIINREIYFVHSEYILVCSVFASYYPSTYRLLAFLLASWFKVTRLVRYVQKKSGF